jgi:catechol 2,3-dioxygenase-like lactoylglutathione lyase family enzyme
MSDPGQTPILAVADVDLATRWYRHVLGFRIDSQRLGINGVPIEACLSRPGGPVLILQLAEVSSPWTLSPASLTLNLEDDPAWVAIRAAAIDNISGQVASSQPSLVLHDPDGHELVLVHAPATS